jgi:pimeloyl-ACP methyl ester carboxylesterase
MELGLEQRIEVEGRRLAWRVAGGGPPLLLINGYAATGADWDPTFLTALAESFEVICPDNRGVGGSALGEEELTIEGMAADCEALLDALGVERLPVVGWSMGGFVAQRLAARAPNRVAALALLATDPGGPDAVLASAEAWTRLIDHTGTPREQASRLISLLFPPQLAAEIDRQFGEVVAEARASLSPVTLRAQEAAMEAWHAQPSADAFAGIAADGDAGDQPAKPPVLIAHGELDEVIPAGNAELLSPRWPDAVVDRLPGCGHALMAQEPQRLSELIHALVSA